jgi:hypothetical protein
MRVWAGIFAVIACLVAAALVSVGASASRVHITFKRELHPESSWAPCNRNATSSRPSTFHPLSDRAAAALVTPEPEVRPYNKRAYSVAGRRYPAANYYAPTQSQLRSFLTAKTSNGQTNLQFNPYYKYVDGLDGMDDPSTDDLIQWAAHKWGIPEDWLRAEYALESYWNAFMLGDATNVKDAWYKRYPPQSRIAGASEVYQSLGITQIRWAPDGSLHPGTEPLRWESTAFNIDYQAATVRFYYDNPSDTRAEWGDASYKPCEAWNSIGAWYDPYPWSNAGQAQYAGTVRNDLATKIWRSTSFLNSSPKMPSDITFAKPSAS